MTIMERIEYDVQCLNIYFGKLFTLAEEASLQESLSASICDMPDSFIAQSVTNLIRPDMICNVYSLVDFWLSQLCCVQMRKNNLALNHIDIKGASDLEAYHKYLTKVAALPLQSVQSSYNHLNKLRIVRNCYIHGGGHIKDEQRTKLEQIPGITVLGSLIIIADSFVWDSLEHAKLYLCAVAQAQP